MTYSNHQLTLSEDWVHQMSVKWDCLLVTAEQVHGVGPALCCLMLICSSPVHCSMFQVWTERWSCRVLLLHSWQSADLVHLSCSWWCGRLVGSVWLVPSSVQTDMKQPGAQVLELVVGLEAGCSWRWIIEMKLTLLIGYIIIKKYLIWFSM